MHLKWKDKKYVNMLSKIYNNEMEEVHAGGKATNKPSVCINYKKLHIGVDLLNQISSSSPSNRKRMKKYCKKVFFSIVGVDITQQSHYLQVQWRKKNS